MLNGNYDWDAFINIEKLQGSSIRSDQERLSCLLKNFGSTNGWKICASILLRDTSFQDVISQSTNLKYSDFFCFRGIEEFIKNYYVSENHLDLVNPMHNFILQYLQELILSKNGEERYIRNKFVQIITDVAYNDYPNKWEQLFKEFIYIVKENNVALFEKIDSSKLTSPGEKSLLLFLKFLISWFYIACDREKQIGDSLEKNTKIKDFMRENDIKEIIDIVKFAIANVGLTHSKIMKTGLKTLSLYISWIDIQYIVGDNTIDSIISPLLIECDDSLKAASFSCISGIINKGMVPYHKIELIAHINEKLNSHEIWKNVVSNAKQIPECKGDNFGYDEDEVDNCYYVTAGDLLNDIGNQLIDSYKTLKESKNDQINYCMQMLYESMKIALDFMYCNNNEISDTCSSFIQNFITLLKSIYKTDVKKTRRSNGIKMPEAQLNEVEIELIKNILMGIYTKIQYPNWYNFENEDDYEGKFQELRKGWLTMMTNMVQLNQCIVMKYLIELTNYTVNNANSLPFQSVEAALVMVYHMGEAVRSVKGDYFHNDCEIAGSLTQIMMSLCVNMLGKHSNTEVRIIYFEVIFRYEKFFNYHPEFLMNIITLFLSEYGLKCNVMRLVTRSVYILSRLIKSHKSKFGDTTNTILQEISAILHSSFCDNSLLSSDNNSTLTAYSYLFESASQLIIMLPSDKIAPFLNQFIQPIVSQISQLSHEWANASRYASPSESAELSTDPRNKQSKIFANSLFSAATYINYCCKAFSNSTSLSGTNCLPIFIGAIDAFLDNIKVAYSKSNHPLAVGRDKINSGFRSLVHIICKSAQSDNNAIEAILQRLPLIIELFMFNLTLTDFDNISVLINELVEIIPLYMQIINGFKNASLTFLKSSLPNLIDIIYKTINASLNLDLSLIPPGSNFNDKFKELVRYNYAMISCDINLIMLAISDEELYRIYYNSFEIIENFTNKFLVDIVAIKNCVTVFQKFISNFSLIIKNDNTKNIIYICIYEKLLPFLILIPSYNNFDLTDAAACLLLNEIANLQRQLLVLEAQQFGEYLQNQCLPKLNFSIDLIIQYCQALNTTDKEFQTFLKNMYIEVKSRS